MGQCTRQNQYPHQAHEFGGAQGGERSVAEAKGMAQGAFPLPFLEPEPEGAETTTVASHFLTSPSERIVSQSHYAKHLICVCHRHEGAKDPYFSHYKSSSPLIVNN